MKVDSMAISMEDTNSTSDEYFRLNNCGYIMTMNGSGNVRRKRDDYHLIYIEKGNGRFYIDGKNNILGPGTVIIHRPCVEQNYSFDKNIETSIVWFHFTGTGVEDILTELGLSENIYHVGEFYEIRNICRSIVHVSNVSKITSRVESAAYMMLILGELSRRVNESELGKYSRVIKLIGDNISINYPNKYFADMYDLSESHFIKDFKRQYGQTPCEYKQSLVITNAITLLKTTNLNITEIASSLGYNDSLYFSKFFKKKTGLSPLKYRKTDI